MLLYSKSSSSDSRCRFAKELVERLTVLDDILCFFQTTYNLDLATLQSKSVKNCHYCLPAAIPVMDQMISSFYYGSSEPTV